ncbi:hypothetical protein D5086_032190 [Populus alba]|uniref:Uncharacterized protein n=1 Tax=Populus alba TaxID=43335 RepID=A0ACC4AKR5_POPAL
MGLMFLWTSVQYQATVVELGAQLISMDSVQISSGPAEAATILALSSGQINTVAILATVAQQITLGLYSALEAVLSQESNGVK